MKVLVFDKDPTPSEVLLESLPDLYCLMGGVICVIDYDQDVDVLYRDQGDDGLYPNRVFDGIKGPVVLARPDWRLLSPEVPYEDLM